MLNRKKKQPWWSPNIRSSDDKSKLSNTEKIHKRTQQTTDMDNISNRATYITRGTHVTRGSDRGSEAAQRKQMLMELRRQEIEKLAQQRKQ